LAAARWSFASPHRGGGRAEIGSAVTMAKIAHHEALGFLAPVANEIGGPAVRAMATVGGNLFAQSPYGDFSVALLALDAEVVVESKSGSETVPLERFLGEREKRIGAIVTNIALNLPPTNAFRFAKVMRRHPHGASILSIAAVLPLANGKVSGARVAFGAMAPTAIRAKAVERALEGKTLDDATIAKAAAAATEETSPASDPFASDWYRRNVLSVHLARLLKR
jgi:CO/xanthine dehydrogenase FAD-binding subunit